MGSSVRRRLTSLVVLGALLTVPVSAQVIRIEDVSPDSSTFDPSDPDAASGGRVNGTAVDPATPAILYAASEWGGLFKSTNSGDTWVRLDGHRPVATWDVEVDPSNSNRVYATSLFDGRSISIASLSGINVSTDGGNTWVAPTTGVPPSITFCANPFDATQFAAFGIDIDPTNNAKVYVGTSCGLAVSSDSGVTWTFTSPVTGAGRIWDVVVSSNGIYVDTCGDDGHQYLDTSTGIWVSGSGLPSGMCSIAASPYDPFNLFVTVLTGIYETTDASSWTQTRTNPRPQGRIPFVETNRRSTAPAGTKFDLWFGDLSLYSVACDSAAAGPKCGTGTTPPWSAPFTRTRGGHDDMGSILFDPTAAVDACPILMSSDGGVYFNTITTSPGCHTPFWEQPTVTPHALWPWALSGADRAGAEDEDLYFGNQDNGVFGVTDAGAITPTWWNDYGIDSFDTAADNSTIIYSLCCFSNGGFGEGRRTLFFKKGAGFAGGGQINAYPPGGLPAADFKFPDSIVRWDANKYAMITRDCTPGYGGCTSADGGVFITQDANAAPIVWTELGNATEPPSYNICGIKAGTAAGVPTFYVQTGSCNADSTTDRIYKFTGTNPAGTWTEVTTPIGFPHGFGLFTVNEADPQKLFASAFTAEDAFMLMSVDGGASWFSPPGLDTLMRGGGNFPIKNQRGPTNFTGMLGYHQPSLVALDPTDPNIAVAGGRDSGIFLSTDAGINWSLVTDPRTSHTSGIPHIPRPRFAYFDSEPNGAKSIYVASQGRGIWRIVLDEGCPPDAFEPDNNGGQASVIGPGVPQTHSICPADDEDWATFLLSEESTVTLETSGPSGDTRMWLYDALLQQIEFDDDDGAGLFSLITRECGVDPLPAGRYYVQIDDFGNNDEIASYDLSLTTVPCCATPSAPAPTTPSDGAVLSDSTPTFEWLASAPVGADEYQLTVQDSSLVTVIDVTIAGLSYTQPTPLADDNFTWTVRGHNTSGGCDVFGEPSAPRSFTIGTSFDVTVAIAGTGSGSVSSAPSGIDCPSVSCSATYPGGTGVLLTAQASPDSLFTGWTGDPDCAVTITATASCTAHFDITSTIIFLDGFEFGDTSGWTDTVGLVTDDHGNNAASASEVFVDFSSLGELEVVGDTDWFRVDTLVAGTSYTFETSLGTLSDSTLTLYDSDGVTVLAYNDDDPGGGLASRIEFSATVTGTYYLEVRAFNDLYTGTYSLTGTAVPLD